MRLDQDNIPNSTVECMIDRLRAAPVSAAEPGDPPGSPSAQPRAATAVTPPVVQPADLRPAPVAPSAAKPVAAFSRNPDTPAGTLPPLPGTAWKIDYGRGKTGDVFLFCSTGTWQILPARGSIGAVGRSFTVAGNTLTTVNRDDGQVQNWRLSGSDGVMVIRDGRQTLTLHYNGTPQCR